MKFALIGSKISYTLSPFIHHFLLQEHNIDGEYDCIDITPDQLSGLLTHQIHQYRGINVTTPFKENIIQHFEHAVTSPETNIIQAVNCIHIEPNQMITLYNTDVYGFIQPLLKYSCHINKKALILGNGGAMKAVKYALNKEYPKMDIHVAARNKHNGYEILYDNLTQLNFTEYGLIINTTPISPYQFHDLDNETILYDLNYRIEKCQFLREHPNTIHINGIAMLVYQAVQSFEIWNNCHVKQSTIEKLFKEIEVEYGIKQ